MPHDILCRERGRGRHTRTSERIAGSCERSAAASRAESSSWTSALPHQAPNATRTRAGAATSPPRCYFVYMLCGAASPARFSNDRVPDLNGTRIVDIAPALKKRSYCTCACRKARKLQRRGKEMRRRGVPHPPSHGGVPAPLAGLRVRCNNCIYLRGEGRTAHKPQQCLRAQSPISKFDPFYAIMILITPRATLGKHLSENKLLHPVTPKQLNAVPGVPPRTCVSESTQQHARGGRRGDGARCRNHALNHSHTLRIALPVSSTHGHTETASKFTPCTFWWA